MPEKVISWKCSTCDASFVSMQEALECESSDSKGPCRLCDRRGNLRPVDHSANTSDSSSPYCKQGYQVYVCKTCGEYWGCRYQYDAGTGADDRWKEQGKDPDKVKRHY